MTIDEAIKHCEEVAEENEKIVLYKPIDFCAAGEIEECTKCAAEHRQLAEWLKDYKRLLGAIDAIKAEIKSKKFSGYANDNGSADLPDHQAHFNSGLILALEIIEKHISGGDTE